MIACTKYVEPKDIVSLEPSIGGRYIVMARMWCDDVVALHVEAAELARYLFPEA